MKKKLIGFAVLLFMGCTSQSYQPMNTVSNVDISRFMGDWFVLANIPTFVDKNAINPLENYQLNSDGTVAITFTYHPETASAPKKTLQMKAFVGDAPKNGQWQVQPFWPIKADYRIVYLDPAYNYAIVGRNKRDYVWIMSRSQNVSTAKLEELLDFTVSLGYAREEIQFTNWVAQPLAETELSLVDQQR